MRTPQWIKKLGGHAGELFVCAELSKRGIPNALLPENFPHDDILVSNKDGTLSGYVQVKACHPDRSTSFYLTEHEEEWRTHGPNRFCVLVWLGETAAHTPPRYWIALKREVGELCVDPLREQRKNPLNPERRHPAELGKSMVAFRSVSARGHLSGSAHRRQHRQAAGACPAGAVKVTRYRFSVARAGKGVRRRTESVALKMLEWS